MRDLLLAFVAESGGVVTRTQALQVVPKHVLDKACAAGAVARLFPSVYALPEIAGCGWARRAGALARVGAGALSHLDGLDVWGIYSPADQPAVHVTVPEDHGPRRIPAIVLHRRRGFVARTPHIVVRQGLRVVRLEQAVVDSWPLLPEIDRRVPAIVASRERRTTGGRLLRSLAANPQAVGATEMRRLFHLVAAGCHSPLELWGHENVFDHPSLPGAVLQRSMTLSTGRIYLDRYYDDEKIDVELDGAAYHGAPRQREKDIRRDVELAAHGIVVIRFSHPRLHTDPAGCRAQVREVLRMRREQLGLPAA